MSETTTLSTIVDSRVKDAAIAFCTRRGVKMRDLIEQALIEQLEDEIDLEAFQSRRKEDTISLHEAITPFKKGRKNLV